MDLEDLFAKLPDEMRKALMDQDPEFAEEMALTYISADNDARDDMLAFFKSNGPKLVHDAKCKHEDGTPMSDDLKRWLEE